ncbi:hypothetical protein HN873_050970 [Arachis hypogaea]|nr:uncharacterized protein LOC112749871 [Arachis hypogaea]QHO11315.1 uncharacterized protein DS421_15g497060 [Arachis hypogaea]
MGPWRVSKRSADSIHRAQAASLPTPFPPNTLDLALYHENFHHNRQSVDDEQQFIKQEETEERRSETRAVEHTRVTTDKARADEPTRDDENATETDWGRRSERELIEELRARCECGIKCQGLF